ncbi:MAG TPA: hydroxymethylbilane synthase [Bacillota bacterium]
MAGRSWRVGTRGSRLARAQTAAVVRALERAWPGERFETVTIRTTGDRDRRRPLGAFATNGIFVKEIERALLHGRIDLAVHSAKDLPSESDPGLAIAAFPPRAAVHDVMITPRDWPPDADGLPRLPQGARVGTSSVRRSAQLREWRPDLELHALRGNVDGRLRKLWELELDAIVLAAAGLMRLGLLPGAFALGQPLELDLPPGRRAHLYPLDPERFVPAAGQGALAVQIRRDDAAAAQLLEPLNDPATEQALRAERSYLEAMGASCAVPIGAYARVGGQELTLYGYYAAAHPPRSLLSGPRTQPEELGRALARKLRAAPVEGG